MLEYTLMLLLIYVLNSARHLLKFPLALTYQPSTTKKSEIETACDELERAYSNYKNSPIPKNLANSIMQLRIAAMELQKYSQQSPEDVERLLLLDNEENLSTKAIYYYLCAHQNSFLINFEEQELNSLPPFLCKLVTLQTRFIQAFKTRDTNSIRSFFNGLTDEERVLLNMVNVSINSININACDLSGINLSHAKFKRCSLKESIFRRSYLDANSFTNCDLRELALDEVHISHNQATLRHCQLSYQIFSKLKDLSELRDFSFNDFHGPFAQTRFDCCDLSCSRFVEGDFSETSFENAIISQTQFLTAMRKADFSKAIFSQSTPMQLIESTITKFITTKSFSTQNYALNLVREYHTLLSVMGDNRYSPHLFDVYAFHNYASLYEHKLLSTLLGSKLGKMQAKLPQKTVAAAGSLIDAATKVGFFLSKAKHKLKQKISHQPSNPEIQERCKSHSVGDKRPETNSLNKL